jgi:molybdate transport system substrate-binding protein
MRRCLLVLVWSLVGVAPGAHAQAVTVFAASSLTDAMNEAVRVYGGAVRTSYAASSTLARQIESGAPADLFYSADEDWMDYLEKRSLIEPGTRVTRLSNRLVLVAPAGAPRKVDIRRGTDLLPLLGPSGRLATGDPSNVPVGRYARQSLTWLGQWQALEPRLARADNVRVALAYVERGEAPLGIVYSTDAAMARDVQVVGEFPAESHAPIRYPVAIVARHATPEARRLLSFLGGPEAAPVFRRYGFEVN